MPQDIQRPRVLIADDDPGMSMAVGRLLSPACDIVGYAADVATLFEAAVASRPDVVLLDFSLPGDVKILAACRRLRQIAPAVKIVAFTAHNDEGIRRAAFEAGCSDFVWKLEADSALLSTIQSLVGDAEGESA